MAITLADSSAKTEFANTDSIASNGVDLTAGHLAVMVCVSTTDITPEACTDNASTPNTWTLRTMVSQSSYRVVMAYSFITTTKTNAAVTFTWVTASNGRRNINVLDFTPDAVGDTWTLDGDGATGGGNSTAVLSGNESPGAGKYVGVAGAISGAASWSEQQIMDQAATDVAGGSALLDSWYLVFSGPQTNIHAQATLSGPTTWAIDYCNFKATAGGGATTISTGRLVGTDLPMVGASPSIRLVVS